MKQTFATIAALAAALPLQAYASNGFNLEGYGPISAAMGGTSLGFDHGVSAVMGNPATLGLMTEGSRIDLGGARIGSSVSLAEGGAAYLPAGGWVHREGTMSYGVAVFSQGGIGLEYPASSAIAAGSGAVASSHLRALRVAAPLAVEVRPDLIVGATLDYVRGSMNLGMAGTGTKIGSLIPTCSGSACGSLSAIGSATWARLDFENATGSGFAAKIGALYKASPSVSIGAVFQTATGLSDLQTDDGTARLSSSGSVNGTGKVRVRDFNWPSIFGAGVAWNPKPSLLLALDFKQIQWASVMNQIHMNFDGPNYSPDIIIPQNWRNQTLLQAGAAFRYRPQVLLRAGLNITSNPIPDATVSPFFPATSGVHVTAGAGYELNAAASFDGSLSYAPSVGVINSDGQRIDRHELNFQAMYSFRY